MNEDIHFTTLITRDYHCFAKSWADSVRRVYPDSQVSICIADRASAAVKKALDPHTVIELPRIAETKLGIENYGRMAFQYTPFELTCALKPFVMRYLLSESEKTIYMDADTQLFGRLDNVEEYLQSSNVVLTPHLSRPSDIDSEHRIQNAGTINGGFIAVRNNLTSEAFLQWWSDRCKYDCYVDAWSGRFVDQTWLDLVPSLFDGVEVSRDKSLNVAYWNIKNRHIERTDKGYFVDGKPLRFFHFSGFNLSTPLSLSKFSDGNISPAVKRLLAAYTQSLLKNFNPTLDETVCEYRRYSNGESVDPIHREAIRSRHPEFIGIKNPFDLTSNPNLPGRFEKVREELVLGRKEWQIEELQAAANRQNQWIKRKIDGRFNKRAVRAFQNAIRFFRKNAA